MARIKSVAMKGVSGAMKVREVKTIQEFKAFIMKGNVLDLAVGIIIGVAFGTVVNSMVNDVIMPPIGLAVGGVDFKDTFVVLKAGKSGNTSYANLKLATDDGAVTWRVGQFVNTVINFLIVAWAVFMLVKAVGKMRAKEEAKAATKKEATEKECPHCLLQVPIKASKCGHCTSEIGETTRATTPVEP
jgi:large conductance mechanosensitive channel